MDYGTDFLLVDGDIVFTLGGDVQTVEGPQTITQDIASELGIAPGTLPWDENAGSTIVLMLNSEISDDETIISELERVAIADPRVDPQTVKAEKTGENTYRLSFTPLAAVSPEILDFNFVGGTNE
jgi:hypothetical protein